MRHSQKKQFHIPHSRILEWNWNVDFHSTFHIPMHFSKVRNETFSKKTIPHSRILEWNWNVDFHSTFQIPYSKPLEFDLESELGIHLHSKFHSIPIPLWLSQTCLQCCSILSSIPIPQWMEWNVESRFDTGCCLELLFASCHAARISERSPSRAIATEPAERPPGAPDAILIKSLFALFLRKQFMSIKCIFNPV